MTGETIRIAENAAELLPGRGRAGLFRRFGGRKILVPPYADETLAVDAIGRLRAQPEQRRDHYLGRDEYRAIGRQPERGDARVDGASRHENICGHAGAFQILRQRRPSGHRQPKRQENMQASLQTTSVIAAEA